MPGGGIIQFNHDRTTLERSLILTVEHFFFSSVTVIIGSVRAPHGLFTIFSFYKTPLTLVHGILWENDNKNTEQPWKSYWIAHKSLSRVISMEKWPLRPVHHPKFHHHQHTYSIITYTNHSAYEILESSWKLLRNCDVLQTVYEHNRKLTI